MSGALTTLTVGLSTCPNDTFLFHGLLEGLVDTRGLELEFVLADVQELNESLAAGSLHVGKASFAAALALTDRYGVLPVGSALGFGVGPVLLARPGLAGAPRSLLAPGRDTTAALLLRCLHPEWTEVRHLRFDRIMPALRAGEADAGVCIHEGRFTYASAGEAEGLELLEDLGASWEALTGLPVPLGGLLARLDLGADVHARLVAALSDSLALARRDPDAALPSMRRHAQELDDEVIRQHVALYVNEHTAALGELGRACLEELARRAGRSVSPPILG